MIRKIRGSLCILFGAFFGLMSLFLLAKGIAISQALWSGAFGALAIWWGVRLFRASNEPENPLEQARKKDLSLQIHLFRNHSLHTLILIASSVIPYFLINVAHGLSELNRETALAYGADFVPYVARGQVWRLLTSTFLHFNLVHLVGNMLALLTVGRYVDYYYGHKRLYFIYFATAIAASMSSNVMHPSVWGVGASGAIFGLYGAFAATFFVKHPDKSKLKFSAFAMIYIASHIMRSLAAGFGQIGVDNAAHVGGFLSGAALGFVLLASEFDWDLVRNATVGVFIGIFGVMQFTVYRHAPTMAQIQAKEAVRQEWIGLAKRSQKYSNLMTEFQAQVNSVQKNQITPQQFQQNYNMSIKPEIELIRMDLYTLKVSNPAAYQVQLDLYNSVVTSEKMLSALFAGRQVASDSTQAVDTFKRAVNTINAALLAEN